MSAELTFDLKLLAGCYSCTGVFEDDDPRVLQDPFIDKTVYFWFRKAGVLLSDEEAKACIGSAAGVFGLLAGWHDAESDDGLAMRDKCLYSRGGYDGAPISGKK